MRWLRIDDNEVESDAEFVTGFALRVDCGRGQPLYGADRTFRRVGIGLHAGQSWKIRQPTAIRLMLACDRASCASL